MGIRIRSIHKLICIILWSAWAVGILLLLLHLILLLLHDGVSHDLFFLVVYPYNRVVLLFSLLPIEPIVLIAALIQDIRTEGITKDVSKSLLWFVITAVIWLIYVGLFILLTGM